MRIILSFIIFFIHFFLISKNTFSQTNSSNSSETIKNQKKILHYLTIKGAISTNYYLFQNLDQTKRTSGFGIGVMYDYWFYKDFAVTSELLYVQKKFDGPLVKFHYLGVDGLFKISTDKKIYVAFGFGFDILVKRNYDFEHKNINGLDFVFIFAFGIYLNLWNNIIFFNGEVRARGVLNSMEFVSWGKRRIATTSIELGLTLNF